MNLRLAALNVYLPAPVRDEGLHKLFRLTADAFRAPLPDIERLSHSEQLRAYAMFTQEQAQRVKNEDVESVKERLFERSRRLGVELREKLHVGTFEESLTAARILYRALGIDFRAHESGGVEVRRCYFSGFYSSQVCRLISSLDEGLIAGLSDGGRLTFSARISEGHDCCLARIDIVKANQ